MDRILVPELRLEARVGVGDEERAAPQALVLEIEIGLDLRPAGTTDDLLETIDYEEVCAVAESVVGARAYHLIETVAEAVAAALLERFPAAETRVQVRKPGALRHRAVPYAAVEVRRRRDAV